MAAYNLPDNISASNPDAPWRAEPTEGFCACGEITGNWTGEVWVCADCEKERREGDGD